MDTLIEQADLETLKALQLLDIESLEGISEAVAKQVRTKLQSIVMSGGSFATAVEELQKSADKLSQHALTYMNTSRSELSQKISDISAENYDGAVYWEYFGAVLDDKTREICQMALGAISSKWSNAPFFTDAEKQEFQTTYGIRWNCRHEFDQITEKYYMDMTGNEK
ncbi:MAG: hypothetical protein U9N34_05200 [Candidatus Cloacimonadota bacterium]|nr:hypothetical protein [Candidatus Cloacimonadota bacterium]